MWKIESKYSSGDCYMVIKFTKEKYFFDIFISKIGNIYLEYKYNKRRIIREYNIKNLDIQNIFNILDSIFYDFQSYHEDFPKEIITLDENLKEITYYIPC